MSAPTARTSPSSSARRWRRALSFAIAASSGVVLMLGGLTGCGDNDPGEQVIENCTAEAVKAIAADGTCQWMSSCDAEGLTRCDGGTRNQCEDLPAEACGFDADCRVVGTTSCPGCAPGTDPDLCTCTTSTLCEPIPSTGCADLDEAACVLSDVCHPSFGWSTGGSAEPSDGGGGGDDSAGAPCLPEFGCEVYVPEPTWTYLGCVDNTTGPCAGLDHSACEQHPGCEPIWGGGDCLCEPDTNCECPAIAVYEGCRQTQSPTGCEAQGTEQLCNDTPGCTWDYTWDEKVACPDCVDDNCACDIAPQSGTCIDDYPTTSCSDILDQASCVDVGCQWEPDATSGGAAPPAPCDCVDDDPACWDACGDGQRPEPIGGACVEPTPQPTGCYDHWDQASCEQRADCQWFPNDGTAPAPAPDPCICPDDDPDCGCAGLIAPADGYCGDREVMPPESCADATDELSCTSIPGCSWNDTVDGFACEDGGPVEPPPCEGLDEQTCTTVDGCTWSDTGAEAPPCPPEDPNCGALIACDPDSALDDAGICRDSTGAETLEVCCDTTTEPTPTGTCEVAP